MRAFFQSECDFVVPAPSIIDNCRKIDMINMLPFVKDNMMLQDEPIMNLQQFVNSYFIITS